MGKAIAKAVTSFSIRAVARNLRIYHQEEFRRETRACCTHLACTCKWHTVRGGLATREKKNKFDKKGDEEKEEEEDEEGQNNEDEKQRALPLSGP